MHDDYSVEELLRLARILDVGAEVLEEPVTMPEAPAENGWRLAVYAPTIPILEVRSLDQERGRRLMRTSLVELLSERGLLGRQLWMDTWGDEPDPGPDPEYIKYRDARERDAATLAHLQAVFEADESEETIQKCIEERPHLWRFVTASNPFVLPKLKLGERYVTDFMILGSAHWSQSQMRTATFVELERPGHRLFNRKGDPTAEFTHGLRQLGDWKQWITDNRTHVRDMFVEHGWLEWERSTLEGGGAAGLPPFGFVDQYLLVIGRRNTMSADERLRLHRMNEDSGFTIITYDVLLDSLLPESPFVPWSIVHFGPP